MGSVKRKDEGEKSTDDDRRRLELSLVLELEPEEYCDADGKVNEDLICREALNYAAEAAKREFEVKISRVSEDDL